MKVKRRKCPKYYETKTLQKYPYIHFVSISSWPGDLLVSVVCLTSETESNEEKNFFSTQLSVGDSFWVRDRGTGTSSGPDPIQALCMLLWSSESISVSALLSARWCCLAVFHRLQLLESFLLFYKVP